MSELSDHADGKLKLAAELNVPAVPEIHNESPALEPGSEPELAMGLFGLQELETFGVQLLSTLRKSGDKSCVAACLAQILTSSKRIAPEPGLR